MKLSTMRLSVLVPLILLVTSVALADDRIIPRGSKIYIGEIPEDVGMYLKAEIVKKKIPIQIVTKEEDADYLLQGIAEGDEDRKWHEGWLTGTRDHTTAAIQIVDKEGNFVWASEAGDRSAFFGALRRGGPRKVADRLANNLKDIVMKR
jgi:hypothetical protein